MKRYKTFWQRIASIILDALALSLINLIGNLIVGPDKNEHPGWLFTYYTIAFTYAIFMTGKYGQTLGNMVLHIKVVQNENEEKPIGIISAIIRESVGIGLAFAQILLMVLGYNDRPTGSTVIFILMFGWICTVIISMLLNNKTRAIHDLMSGSVVINIPSPTPAEEKIIRQGQENI